MDIPPSLHAVAERVAAQAHDTATRDRLAAGWRHGQEPDEAESIDPRLVPFTRLPEADQLAARDAALTLLRALTELGYEVTSGRPGEAGSERGVDELLRQIDRLAGTAGEAGALLRIWSSRRDDDPVWRSDVEPYRRLAQRCLKIGVPNIAIEIARAGREVSIRGPGGEEARPWERDAVLRKIEGVALARNDCPQLAVPLLEALKAEGSPDEETLGTLAGACKDIALAAADPERGRLLDRAITLYQEAHERTGGTWTGINVASLLTLRGHTAAAWDWAERVRGQCHRELATLEADGGDRYWVLATLGEAALNLGDWAEAEASYRRAHHGAARRYGDILETRRQAELLVGHLGGDRSLPAGWLPIPKVVIFTGHMIDRPGRPRPRFPEAAVDRVAATLREWLGRQGEVIGFSSAACGSDILFQEIVHALGGETHVLLPYDEESFCRESVQAVDPPVPIPGRPSWQRRYLDVLARASHVVMASAEKMRSDGVSYAYTNEIMHGLGLMKARQLGTEVVGLAVWDGRPGDGRGGTASTVAEWRMAELPVHVVNLGPEALGRADAPAFMPVLTVDAIPTASPPVGGDDNPILAMLFADAVGFSKLTEPQVPLFVRHCLGPIGELITSRYRESIIVRNTWGDGLYIVFTTVDAAGRFALDLAELMAATDWRALGLPADLALRIALHAGPVYRCTDPVTGQLACTGTHVSRAARLEPRTPPGAVYASEAFAALAAVAKVDAFTCDYVRQLSWAKHYGTFPTYVVRRA